MRITTAAICLVLILIPAASGAASIEFTHIPVWGSTENLSGMTHGATPPAYRVAVYICVEGQWWTKPNFDAPLTPINPDSTWVCDVTTGGLDSLATRYIAFLVPQGWIAYEANGVAFLPDSLYLYPHAHTTRLPGSRTISFCNLQWVVKRCSVPMGPGPNYFTDRTQDVWVDSLGLHLKLLSYGGHWYCSEVILNQSLGHGEYTFYVRSPVDAMDQNIVLGLFTWDEEAVQSNYREMDIEFSRWGQPQGQNAQFVVQPWDTPGNRHQFNLNAAGPTAHRFTWCDDEIDFESCSSGSIVEAWSYTGADIRQPGNENVRINLWLLNGTPPTNGQPVEITISGFRFCPVNSSCVVAYGNCGGSASVPADGVIADRGESGLLSQNRPNPFGGKTEIEFDLPASGGISLRIYDSRGMLVRSLFDSELGAGKHSLLWDGTNDRGKAVSSGMYFYQLTAGDRNLTRQAIVLK